MLIFSDIHFGIQDNNDTKLADAEQCIDWIIETGKANGEKTCIFAGDWFNDRSEIGVNTLAVAKRCLKKLSEAFEEVFMLAGNHDNFYNNNNELSSLDIYCGMFANVTIIIDRPLVVDREGIRLMLAPWLYDPNVEMSSYDVLIGHFEFIGGKMNGRLSGGKYGIQNLLAVAPLVFTGHYHLTAEYDRANGKVISIGSPIQHGWDDSGDDKRIVILNKEGFRYIYNQISPKFISFPASKLSGLSEEKLGQFFGHPSLKNCSIRLINTESVDQETISNMIPIARSGNLRSFDVAYSVSNSKLVDAISENIQISEAKPPEAYVHEFVDSVLENEKFAAIDGKEMHELIESIMHREQK
jgi:DNA repair exonuclease SbcCD nuclease subunit